MSDTTETVSLRDALPDRLLSAHEVLNGCDCEPWYEHCDVCDGRRQHNARFREASE